MVAGYPPHLQAFRILLLVDDLQLDLDAPLVLQRQPIAHALRTRVRLRGDLIVDGPLDHLQDIRLLQLGTNFAQFKLEASGVFM